MPKAAPFDPNNFVPSEKQLTALPRLQNAWRSYTNRKVYKYYRDVILQRTQTNPIKLLKTINPSETQLLDNAANLHIRFRLGGERFPPTIYYKIFSHGGVIDINSFAPREYAAVSKEPQRDSKKLFYSEYKKEKIHHDGWYIRQENNGWRPMNVKLLENKKDYVEVVTNHKVKYFHHDKDLRKKKNEKQKRLNKLRWFQTMFEKAREEEPALKDQRNPFENPNLIDAEDGEFDQEVDELIEWSDNLDFDKYNSYWKHISTSTITGQQFGSYRKEDHSFIQTEFEHVD